MIRCVVQKRLPSVARPAFLRHIAPQASSRKWPDLPKPLPMGEVALRSNDGEGKPGMKEPLRSDGQALCQRETSAAPVLPRQRPCPLRRSRASSPKGRALGRPVKFPLDAQSLFVSWTVVPCCLGQRQLDKVRCPEAAALCSEARFFAPYCASSVQ